MSLISVIIPVYNVEDFLEECLRSVAQQDYSDYQVLLIDDGSTDGSSKICECYANKFNWIYIRNSNQGVSYSRNVGLENTNSEFITFIDSDDIVPPNYLSELITAQQRAQADIIVCPHKDFKSSAEFSVQGNISEVNKDKIISGERYLEKFITRNLPSGMGLSLHSKMFKKAIFKEIYFPLNMVYEDNYTFFDIMISSKVVVLTNSTTYYYRKRLNSIVTGASSKKNDEFILAEKKMTSQIEKKFPQLRNDAEARFAEAYMISLWRILRQSGIKQKNKISMMQREIKKRKGAVFNSVYSNKRERILYYVLTNRIGMYFMPGAIRILNAIKRNQYK